MEFCPPSRHAGCPSARSATSRSHGNGGQTATVTALPVTPLATPSARALAAAAVVYIFQLPAMNFLRMAGRWGLGAGHRMGYQIGRGPPTGPGRAGFPPISSTGFHPLAPTTDVPAPPRRATSPPGRHRRPRRSPSHDPPAPPPAGAPRGPAGPVQHPGPDRRPQPRRRLEPHLVRRPGRPRLLRRRLRVRRRRGTLEDRRDPRRHRPRGRHLPRAGAAFARHSSRPRRT